MHGKKGKVFSLENGIPVKVDIRTRQIQSGEKNDYSQKFDGRLSIKNQTLYLRYDESSEARVTFKVCEDDVYLSRKSGQMRLKLHFNENGKFETSYLTPYGAVELRCETDCCKFEYDRKVQRGALTIDYRLFTGDEILGEYKIRLQFAA